MAKRAAIEHYSSEDEAPEEDSFANAAAKTQQDEKSQKLRDIRSNKISKDKRRAKDSKLKEQKKKLLSEILNDMEDEDEEDDNEIAVPAQPLKLTARPVKRRLEVEKDGITIAVAEKTSRKLPPVKSSLLARREKFLSRKSVSRR